MDVLWRYCPPFDYDFRLGPLEFAHTEVKTSDVRSLSLSGLFKGRTRVKGTEIDNDATWLRMILKDHALPARFGNSILKCFCNVS